MSKVVFPFFIIPLDRTECGLFDALHPFLCMQHVGGPVTYHTGGNTCASARASIRNCARTMA